jgi:hypothetical protein
MSHTTITAGLVAPAVVTLADAASIAVNAGLGNDFRVKLGASRSVANPAGGVDGQRITLMITQPAAGSATVTWGSQYKFGAAGAPRLSTAGSSTDVIGFIYNQSLGSWLCVGAALGF